MNRQEQQSLTNRTYPSVEAEDVEGHVARRIVEGPETDEAEEDTEAHMQPPRDLDIDRC